MAPMMAAVKIPKNTLDVLHEKTLLDLVSPNIKSELRLKYEISKFDLLEFQTEANKTAHIYAEHAAHFLKRLPVHLNLVPDNELQPEKIKEMSDEALAAKYRAIRLSVSSSVTGTLINIVLIPFLPAHAIGAVLNGWQTGVTLINRHNAKGEIKKRMLASETSAQIIVIRLDGHKGRAQDVCAGMFFKGILVAATLGFTDICAIPANADSLVTHHVPGIDVALHPFLGAGPGPEVVPGITAPLHDTVVTGAHETARQVAHEALKAKTEAWATAHPQLSHMPFDTAGFAADRVSNSLDASNWAHFGVWDAPKGSSSIADLVQLHQEGIPTGTIVAETGLLGTVAEGANMPAIVGDVLLEERWEKHWEKKDFAGVSVGKAKHCERKNSEDVSICKAKVEIEYQTWSLWNEKFNGAVSAAPKTSSIKRKPVPSRSPSSSPSPLSASTLKGYKRRRGEDTVFLFKD